MPSSDNCLEKGNVGAGEPGPVFVLASSSPRRLELIRRFFDHDAIRVCSPDFDENGSRAEFPDETPTQLVQRLSSGKLEALVASQHLPDCSIALAADTVVTLDGRVLGKPSSAEDAATMLRDLSGKTHSVLTGICLRLSAQGKIVTGSAVEETTVTFGILDESMIQGYVASKEPFDKAGAYGIQGLGAAFVSRIDGCYYNVMGLPVYRLFVLLRELAGQTGSDQLISFVSPMAGQSL